MKTMISVGEADVRMTALVDVTILRGEADRIELRVPAGFAVTGASGSALATSEERSGSLVLTVQRSSNRRHQFLVSLERSVGDPSAFETPLLAVPGADRETGEIAVEAVGTVELACSGNGSVTAHGCSRGERCGVARPRALADSCGAALSPPWQRCADRCTERYAISGFARHRRSRRTRRRSQHWQRLRAER